LAKLAIVATLEVTPGRRDQLLPLLMAHRSRCLTEEPGTLQFEWLLPHDDENKVLIYEVYVDEEAFQAHGNGASMKQIQGEAEGMVSSLVGTRCSPAEP